MDVFKYAIFVIRNIKYLLDLSFLEFFCIYDCRMLKFDFSDTPFPPGCHFSYVWYIESPYCTVRMAF